MKPLTMVGIVFALALLAVFLISCAPTPKGPETKVAVREPCVPASTPKPPAHYADEGARDPSVSPADRYRRIAAANDQRAERLSDIEPIIASCR